MELRLRGEIWHWRGPSPFHFVTVPAPQSARIRAASATLTYGWGVIPVTGTIGATRFQTSLFPKDGAYLVPIKDAVRRAEGLALGDRVSIVLQFDPERPRRSAR
jgi:hypothetical protein